LMITPIQTSNGFVTSAYLLPNRYYSLAYTTRDVDSQRKYYSSGD
jgi:hypothetical protein